ARNANPACARTAHRDREDYDRRAELVRPGTTAGRMNSALQASRNDRPSGFDPIGDENGQRQDNDEPLPSHRTGTDRTLAARRQGRLLAGRTDAVDRRYSFPQGRGLSKARPAGAPRHHPGQPATPRRTAGAVPQPSVALPRRLPARPRIPHAGDARTIAPRAPTTPAAGTHPDTRQP